MAGKKILNKTLRMSEKTEKILKEFSRRNFQDFPTIVRFALLEYIKNREQDLYKELVEEFTPQ